MERYKTKFQENFQDRSILEKCIKEANPALSIISYDENEGGIVVQVELDYENNVNEDYRGRGWGASLQIDLEENPEFNSAYAVEDTRSSPRGETIYIYKTR
jgi:hypothetical protein